MTHSWAKQLIYWRDENRIYVSVVFTWHLPLAYKLCKSWHDAGFYVVAGGPAVELMPDFLVAVTDETCGKMVPLPLSRHNPDATFTTRGCIRRCSFCAVPKTEGEFQELEDWVPAPIVCDNNLLASSKAHFDRVIDRLKVFKGVDFNQGLDARLLKSWHIARLQELRLPIIRFAFDNLKDETTTITAIERMLKAGCARRRMGVYILFGFKDSPEDAMYRAEVVKKLGIKPFLQRYQPLDALQKDSYQPKHWPMEELARFQQYWCRQNWLSKIPYAEFNRSGHR